MSTATRQDTKPDTLVTFPDFYIVTEDATKYLKALARLNDRHCKDGDWEYRFKQEEIPSEEANQ